MTCRRPRTPPDLADWEWLQLICPQNSAAGIDATTESRRCERITGSRQSWSSDILAHERDFEVLCFAASSLVWWPQTLVVMLAAIAGGWLGALVARHVPTAPLRTSIAIFNALMTATVFWKTFL